MEHGMDRRLSLMLSEEGDINDLLKDNLSCPIERCISGAAVVFVTGMGKDVKLYSPCSDHAAGIGEALRVKCAREGKPFAEYRI